ncbi:MAG: patatin-like phospholipase family protein [Alphaproteobacteria bacterium]|nr:patatin-like phospholipase family protein [Alphaproteobacteria bacterium]
MSTPGFTQTFANFFSSHKLGLALSGGGAWGAFTAGSLQALIEAGIIKDKNLAAISGTSAGAFKRLYPQLCRQYGQRQRKHRACLKKHGT